MLKKKQCITLTDMKKAILLLFFIVLGYQMTDAQPLGYEPRVVQSLFAEDYRNDNYEQAIMWGRWLVNERPKEIEGLDDFTGDRNFRRMINIYEYFAEQQDDEEMQRAYLDSSMQMFDRVFEIFEDDEVDKFQWTLRKGRFLQEHAGTIEDGLDRAFALYDELFQMDTERAVDSGDGYYVRILVDHYAREGERERAQEMMERAEPYANNDLLAAFDDVREEVLFAEPEDRVGYVEELLEEDPGNLDHMYELYDLYDDLNMSDKQEEMAVRLYEEDPTYENIMRLADEAAGEDNYEETIGYLEEALEHAEDTERRREVTLRIAENYYSLRDLQQAREWTRRAIDEDSGWGQPYIRMARIYARAVQECTSGRSMDRQDRAVYYLVLDYLDQAVETDANVSGQVEDMYPNFEEVTPSEGDKHFLNWNEGDQLAIDESRHECYAWINETTTVR